MPRPFKQSYRRQEMKELARQLLFAPPARRVEQVLRAEQLHDQIDPDVHYPLSFVVFRVTGYQPESGTPASIPGGDLAPDLRLLIDQLSRSVGLPVRDDDPVDPPDDLARRLGVSEKTLTRWRHLGLRWRWALDPERHRKRVVYPRSASDHFIARHPQTVREAASFSRLRDTDLPRILAAARRLAAAHPELSLHRIARRLASETGRSVLTLRSILDKHDRHNPEAPIFPQRQQPLSARQRRLILRADRLGIPLRRIAEHLHRSPAALRRVLRLYQYQALRQRLRPHSESPIFERPDADDVLLTDPPMPPPSHPPSHPSEPGQAIIADRSDRATPDTPPPPALTPAQHPALPPALHRLFELPEVADDIQRRLVVRYHYLLFKAHRTFDSLDPRQPAAGGLRRTGRTLDDADHAARRLLDASLPGILTAARRHLAADPDRSLAHLLELLGDGLEVFDHALAGYDLTRERSFPAYLNWQLLRRFAARTNVQSGPAVPRPRAHRRDAAEALARQLIARLSPPTPA